MQKGKELTALEDISFDVPKGSCIALLGASGSGKSSLMKCIYRTYLSSGGKIYFNSEAYGQVDLVTAPDYLIMQLRKTEIAYCSQFLQAIPRQSALQVIMERIPASDSLPSLAKEQAKAVLKRLNVPETLWDAFPSTFSGGEQQRVNVAQAIISTPSLLLIDEPTSSLDQESKEMVINELLSLKSKGTTIICISHDPFTIDKLTDKNIYLEKGCLLPNH